jgi:prolipoprotein diacylglyceryltransferase
MAVYLAVYGVARFFLEFLRGDPGRGGVFNGLPTGTQLIAIGLLIGGVVLAVVAERQQVADAACPGQKE